MNKRLVGRLLIWITIVVTYMGCTSHRATPPNQREPLTSPSGKYVLRMPIVQRNLPAQYGPTNVWTVTISKPDGTLVYEDLKSDFLGHFNVYWCWDQNDRVWLYNSDDGRVWYWENVGGTWIKTELSKTNPTVTPPTEVYPDYAKPKK